jgi:L,D-transpeptidase YbiS
MKMRSRAMELGMPPDAFFLIVDVQAQRMKLMDPACAAVANYPVSTSKYGVGEVADSFCTPRGFHEVVERYGDGAEPGSVFVSREFTGEILPEVDWRQSDGDKILTRILRLAGREDGKNRGEHLDSYARMIYIHGTNQEQFVGASPSSHGCIRMKNRDVMALFELVRGTPAWVVIL